MDSPVVQVDHATLQGERDRLLAELAALPSTITTVEEYDATARGVQFIGDWIAERKPRLDALCQKAYEAHRAMTGFRADVLGTPERLLAALRARLGDFKEREDAKRREEEARLYAEEVARERARVAQEAAAFVEHGLPEVAEMVRAEPLNVAPVVLPATVRGDFRTDWHWEPAESAAKTIVGWILRDEHAQFLKLDEPALNAFAKRTKGAVPVKGIRFFSKQVPVRSK